VKEKQQIRLTTGYRTALADGTLVPDSPFHMATERFYHALPGSRLQLNPASHLRGKYLYAVAVFGLDRNPGYIYEYAYQREENWTTYTQNLTSQSYGAEEYVFEAECYFRVCVRRADGGEMSEEDSSRSAEIVEYFHEEPERTVKPCFAEEVKKTVEVIRRMEQKGPLLKLCLLSDTHYTVNAGFSDLDTNDHVNNTKYANFVMDAINPKENEILKVFQIDYRKEVMQGTTLNIHTLKAKNGILAKGTNTQGDIMFACKIELKK